MLAHAGVDLNQPGLFSSRGDQRMPTASAVVMASHEELVEPGTEDTASENTESNVAAPLSESAWAIAEPGKPANLPTKVQDTSGGGGWKASSQPMPAVMAQSIEPAPQQPLVTPRHTTASAPPSQAAKAPAGRPSWRPSAPAIRIVTSRRGRAGRRLGRVFLAKSCCSAQHWNKRGKRCHGFARSIDSTA